MELVDFICELLLGRKAGWCSEHSRTEVRTLTKSSVNMVSVDLSSGTMLSSSVARRSGGRLVKVPRWGLLLFVAPVQCTLPALVRQAVTANSLSRYTTCRGAVGTLLTAPMLNGVVRVHGPRYCGATPSMFRPVVFWSCTLQSPPYKALVNGSPLIITIRNIPHSLQHVESIVYSTYLFLESFRAVPLWLIARRG